jgi:hypothetical protein
MVSIIQPPPPSFKRKAGATEHFITFVRPMSDKWILYLSSAVAALSRAAKCFLEWASM